MSKKPKVAPFAVGDKVTTGYVGDELQVIRTVTSVRRSDKSETGYTVQADMGAACPHCGRRYSSLPPIASSWFVGVPR